MNSMMEMFMSTQLTVSLPDEVADALKRIMADEGISPDDAVRAALRDYLFVRKFRLLREQMMAKAERAYTDEDVFDQVS